MSRRCSIDPEGGGGLVEIADGQASAFAPHLLHALPEPDEEGNPVVPCGQRPLEVPAGRVHRQPLQQRALSGACAAQDRGQLQRRQDPLGRLVRSRPRPLLHGRHLQFHVGDRKGIPLRHVVHVDAEQLHLVQLPAQGFTILLFELLVGGARRLPDLLHSPQGAKDRFLQFIQAVQRIAQPRLRESGQARADLHEVSADLGDQALVQTGVALPKEPQFGLPPLQRLACQSLRVQAACNDGGGIHARKRQRRLQGDALRSVAVRRPAVYRDEPLRNAPDALLKRFDHELVAGLTFAGIGRRFDLSADAVGRHAHKHLVSSLLLRHQGRSLDSPDRLAAEVRAIHAQTLETMCLAGRRGSVRDVLTAIREARRNIEVFGRLVGEIEDVPPPSPSLSLDREWQALASRLLKALEHHPEARSAVAECLLPVGDVGERGAR